MNVYWIEHRGGGRKITKVNYATDERTVVSSGPKGKVKPGDGGYWQRSDSNGVPIHQVDAAKKLDHELGVPIDYDEKGRACFVDAAEKRRWMRAHKVVNHDPMWRDPVPGDFNYGVPRQ